MTEFDLALDFLQTYVRAAASAAEGGEVLDDEREFRRHCRGLGVEPTGERRELARDLAVVIREWVTSGGPDRQEEGREMHVIPNSAIFAGLERYGWRVGFLNAATTR
jgi:hypothetical protein